MNKTGILTFTNVVNYGAELQAFALVAKLRQLGYDAELIDFKQSARSGFQGYLVGILRRMFHSGLRLKSYFRNVKQYGVVPPTKTNIYGSDSIRQQRHREFWNDTPHSSETFTRDLIYAEPPLYDIFIVGSDQVWNYRLVQDLDVYLLNFVGAGACRMSYAASIAVKRIPLCHRLKYRMALGKFTAISLRESLGCKLVANLIQREVEHVLDPTLLLTKDEWSKEERSSDIHGSYILLYTVRAPTKLYGSIRYYLLGRCSLKNINEKALELSRIMNLPVVSVTQRYGKDSLCFTPEIMDKSDAGPREFLGLIRNAAFVLTNSFHGTAFSINFGRNFITVSDPDSPVRSMRSRIESLLSLFDLSDRLVSTDVPISEWPSDVDYTKVHALLDEKREQSLKWLVNSLESCSEKK